MSAENWTPAPGERVAVMRSYDYGRSRSVEFATIDRIGKRDIVLDDGRRFKVNGLDEQGPQSAWGSTHTRLVSADAPVVAEVERDQIRRGMVQRAESACESFRYRREGVTAADVILALAPLTGVADEIAALFVSDTTTTP